MAANFCKFRMRRKRSIPRSRRRNGRCELLIRLVASRTSQRYFFASAGIEIETLRLYALHKVRISQACIRNEVDGTLKDFD